MENKNNNRLWIFITGVIIILLIAIPAFVKVYNNHRVKLYNSTIENIKYKALKCYREDNCGTTITLQELYDLKYAKTLVNPLTKEIYDSNITLTIKDDKVTFNG